MIIFERINFDLMLSLTNRSLALNKILRAAFMKIFLNYMQCINFVSKLSFNWGSVLGSIFNFHSSVSGTYEMIALECIFPSNYYYFF